jgi:hypothetical protein
MSDSQYVVQKVEWFQFRAPDGKAFFVMVSSLPNGFFTAVPVELPVVHGDHSLIALAASPDDALAQLQQTLTGKQYEEIFPAK